MSKPEIVIAIYKAKDGKIKELESLVIKHFPTLRDLKTYFQSFQKFKEFI